MGGLSVRMDLLIRIGEMQLNKALELLVVKHCRGFMEDQVNQLRRPTDIQEQGIIGDPRTVERQPSQSDLGEARQGGRGVSKMTHLRDMSVASVLGIVIEVARLLLLLSDHCWRLNLGLLLRLLG